MIREARHLGVYIERGREWLRSVGERVKSLGPALSGLGVPGLVQGAARTMRAELDKGGSGGMTLAIGKGSPDGERGLPGFDHGRDDRGRGGHER